MKRKEFNQIKKKSLSELVGLVSEKKEQLTRSQLEHKIGKLKNTRTMKAIKKDIAQLLTLVQEKKLLKKMPKESIEKESKNQE